VCANSFENVLCVQIVLRMFVLCVQIVSRMFVLVCVCVCS